MSRKLQNFIAVGLFGFLCLHFFLLCIYTFPFQPQSKTSINYYAQWYTYPFFNQSWNLFVPAPNTNYRCFVSYDYKGNHRVDLMEEVLNNHQFNRLKGYSSLVLILANSMHYFEKNTSFNSKLNGPVKSDLNFTILENSAKNYIEISRGYKVSNFKLILCAQIVGELNQRVYFNDFNADRQKTF